MKFISLFQIHRFLSIIFIFLIYAHSFTNDLLGNPLDSNLKSTSELAPLQPVDSELLESINFHNIDDELRNKDILDTGVKDEISFDHNNGGCDVLKEDYIEVALDPHDILKTQEFVYSVSPTELRLYFKDRNSKRKENAPPKKGKLFARFSFNSIVTPFETTASSRECFRMFYKESPIIFCSTDTKSRDYFIVLLTKAKFCHFAHTTLSPAHKASGRGKKPFKLPQYSTKKKRLQNLLSTLSGNPAPEQHENNITNIDIKNLSSGKPQIFLNGEEVDDSKAKS